MNWSDLIQKDVNRTARLSRLPLHDEKDYREILDALKDEIAKLPPRNATYGSYQAWSPYWSVVHALFENPTVPEDVHVELVTLLKHFQNYYFAAHEIPHLTPRVLLMMARHPNDSLREAAATHPLTDAKTLAGLATDKRAAIRSRVANHRTTPVQVLEELTKDKAITVSRNAENSLKYIPKEVGGRY